MPARAETQRVVDAAIKRAPATITKRSRGQPSKDPTKRSFKAYTVTELLTKWRDPRDVLLEIASMDTAELAEKIGCTKYEALGERRLCAQTVLPYVAAKMPVQVDMRSQRTINLNIVDSTQMQQLEQLASEPQLIEAQVLTTIGTEGDATEDSLAEGDETSVQPSAPSTAQEDSDAGK